MAFNASGKSGEFHYLAEMFLDGTTIYAADEDLSIQVSNTTGQFYEGRLPVQGTIRRSLGTFLEPKETVSSLDLVFDDRDGKIRGILTEYIVANRSVDVWVGEGTSKANYSLVFPGVVAHPSGVSWDDETATFTIIDKRVKVRKVLPLNKYTTDNLPFVEDRAINLSIPIVYGDFSSAADNQCQVRAWCIDTSAAKFQVADHGLLSIDRYLKNAIRLSSSSIRNVSLSQGTFELTGVAYDATNDIVSVNCQGLHTINNTLIETPIGCARHIYTAYMGLTGSDLNGTAFHEVDVETGSDKVRSVINADLSTETILGGLLSEAAIDMRFVGSQYSPKARNLDLVSARQTFRESDIVIGNDLQEKALFRVSRDPDRISANKVRTRYAYSAIDAQYLGSFTHQLTSAVENVSAVLERPIDFDWYYRDQDTQTRAQREVAMFSTEPTQIEMTVTSRAILGNLADQIDLVYNVFDGEVLQIRDMELDLAAMVVRIGALKFLDLGAGRWTLDTAPDWSSSNASDKSQSGYWLDANGYADPSDSTSRNISRWF